MKNVFKQIVSALLAVLAREIIKKYNPKVVMVTGSVGKTSTKDACAVALTPHFSIHASEKSFNSEFGVPLSIIGVKNPWDNPYLWFRVFEEALSLILFPSTYPELLVLEVGADKPGDLAHILSIVKPDAVVLTRLPEIPVHVESYADPEKVREEERMPALFLKEGGVLVYNASDVHGSAFAQTLEVKKISYGEDNNAQVRISSKEITYEQGVLSGMKADIMYEGATYPIHIKHAVGFPHLLAPAGAFALAISLGVSPKKVCEALSQYVPPAGRGRLIHGKNNSMLIDDSYNASPAAVEMALSLLKEVQGHGRKIVVLGDMLELGQFSVSAHEVVGKQVAQVAHMFIAAGVRMKDAANAAEKAGLSSENIISVASSTEAKDVLLTMVKEKDVVLVKGSQSMRMERVVKGLLETQEDAQYLVRQEKEWLKK